MFTAFFKMGFKKTLQSYVPPVPNLKVGWVDRFIIGFGFALIAGAGAMVAHSFYIDSRSQPRVGFQSSDWHVLFDDDAECAAFKEVASSCVASPQNSALWNATTLRGSKEFVAGFDRRKIHYWLGTTVSTAQLREASRADASVLVFAPLQGASNVFIDGVLQVHHRYIDQGLPIQVTLSQQRLSENKDLSIAIQVSPFPFYAKAKAAGAGLNEGFFTAVDADHLMRWTMFYGLSRHLFAFIVFLLLARILWKTSAAQTMAYDYLAGAQFALVMCAISLASLDLVLRMMNVFTYYRLSFTLLIWEAVFLIRLSLSYLRASRSFSILHAVALVAGTVGILNFTSVDWIEGTGVTLMTSIVLPAIYGMSALLLGYRAWEMTASKLNTQAAIASDERINFLLFASFLMGVTAIAYVWESSKNPGLDVYMGRVLNIGTIYLLVRLITRTNQVTLRQDRAPSVAPYPFENRR